MRYKNLKSGSNLPKVARFEGSQVKGFYSNVSCAVAVLYYSISAIDLAHCCHRQSRICWIFVGQCQGRGHAKESAV